MFFVKRCDIKFHACKYYLIITNVHGTLLQKSLSYRKWVCLPNVHNGFFYEVVNLRLTTTIVLVHVYKCHAIIAMAVCRQQTDLSPNVRIIMRTSSHYVFKGIRNITWLMRCVREPSSTFKNKDFGPGILLLQFEHEGQVNLTQLTS